MSSTGTCPFMSWGALSSSGGGCSPPRLVESLQMARDPYKPSQFSQHGSSVYGENTSGSL